jgi:TolB-like protein/transcriptional regulator with XRE-family HTH domain/Tfp pilus assembly protein PilF
LIIPASERVRYLRQAKGWTQEDLANEAGRSKGAIEAVENAQRLGRRVQVRTLADIAAALDVSVESLLYVAATRKKELADASGSALQPVLLPEGGGRPKRIPLWIGGSIAVATGAVLLWTWIGLPVLVFLKGAPVEPPLPEKPGVAILRFDTAGLMPERRAFADGMVDELTTRLAKVPALFVIAPSSSAMYQGVSVDPRRIGRELGVQYLVEGAVRSEGERMRITARLIETKSGLTIWSDGYDVVHGDVLGVQSRIAQGVVIATKVEIEAADLARVLRAPTSSHRAYDAVLHALNHLHRGTRADHALARKHLERALEIDHRYADAYAMLGAAAFIEYANMWNLDPAMLDRAVQLSHEALALDRSSHQAYITLANTYLLRGQSKDALTAAEIAVDLDPSGEWAHATLGLAWLQNGRPLAAVREVNLALRLNPLRPNGLLMPVAMVNFLAGRKEYAAELWEQIRAASPDLIAPRVPLVSYYEKRGRYREARTVAAEIRAINPELSAEAAVGILPELAGIIGEEEVAQFKLRLQSAGLQ